MKVVKLLYDMVFITRTAKFDRDYLRTGSYTSVLKNLIPPNPSTLEFEVHRFSVQNHETSGLHTESLDSACMMLDSLAYRNEGKNTNTSSSYYS